MTTDFRAVDLQRPLGIAWLVAAVPVGVSAFLLTALAERAGERLAGTVLTVLLVVGVAVGAWLLAGARGSTGRTVSLVASGLWAVGAVVIYPTTEFAADALWAAGLPLLGAVVTAVLALRS
jgi:hypothetical protein